MRRPYHNTHIFLETKRQLASLYLEYKRLQGNKDLNTTEENIRLEDLITIISRLEYKFVSQLKSRQK